MRFLFIALLGLGFFTGCGEVQEFQNVKVEAVEGGYSITDENGAQELVSKVEYSTELNSEGGATSMAAEAPVDICCAECHRHGDGTIHCTGCSYC